MMETRKTPRAPKPSTSRSQARWGTRLLTALALTTSMALAPSAKAQEWGRERRVDVQDLVRQARALEGKGRDKEAIERYLSADDTEAAERIASKEAERRYMPLGVELYTMLRDYYAAKNNTSDTDRVERIIDTIQRRIAVDREARGLEAQGKFIEAAKHYLSADITDRVELMIKREGSYGDRRVAIQVGIILRDYYIERGRKTQARWIQDLIDSMEEWQRAPPRPPVPPPLPASAPAVAPRPAKPRSAIIIPQGIADREAYNRDAFLRAEYRFWAELLKNGIIGPDVTQYANWQLHRAEVAFSRWGGVVTLGSYYLQMDNKFYLNPFDYDQWRAELRELRLQAGLGVNRFFGRGYLYAVARAGYPLQASWEAEEATIGGTRALPATPRGGVMPGGTVVFGYRPTSLPRLMVLAFADINSDIYLPSILAVRLASTESLVPDAAHPSLELTARANQVYARTTGEEPGFEERTHVVAGANVHLPIWAPLKGVYRGFSEQLEPRRSSLSLALDLGAEMDRVSDGDTRLVIPAGLSMVGEFAQSSMGIDASGLVRGEWDVPALMVWVSFFAPRAEPGYFARTNQRGRMGFPERRGDFIGNQLHEQGAVAGYR